jgi:hypothetical protein
LALNIDPNRAQPAERGCSSGEKVVGGGWDTDTANVLVVATQSKLLDERTWQFTFFNATNTTQRVLVYAICAG